MKHPIAVAAIIAAALSTSVLISQVVQKSPQTQRFPQFENEDVKVWKTIVMPHQPLAMHHHDHPRVIIALTGGTMNIVDPAGNIEPHVWETGKAYWLPAMPPTPSTLTSTPEKNPWRSWSSSSKKKTSRH